MMSTRHRPGLGGAVWAARGDGVEGVRDHDQAGAERDRLAGESVRVAAAVPALVVPAYRRRDTGEVLDPRDDGRAGDRVDAHQRLLRLVQRGWLTEYRVWNGDLADVVQ